MRLHTVLILLLLSTPAAAQFPSPSQSPTTGLWNDQSAVVGSDENLTSHASRFNHLLVGEASTKTASFAPSTPISWMDTLISNVMVGGQISVTSTVGASGINAAARTSDLRTAFGGASGGSAGAYLFGVNDDAGFSGSIALGSNNVGIHQSGLGITLGTQNDINSILATCVPTPQSTLCAGQASTIGNLITAGAFSSLATQDVTEALLIGEGFSGGPKFNAGIVIDGNAIRSAVGPTILGSSSTIGIALPVVNYIIWYSGGSPSSAVWGGGGGSLNFFVSNTLTVNGNAGVSCPAGINVGSFRSVNGLVTAC